MLSISSAIKGSGEYYLSLAREDYYLEGGEPPGEWIGAENLGAFGEVFGDDLRNLMQGRDVYGEKSLVQNAEDKTRRSAWDLTFSAPKSVSVLWSQADLETRHKIQLAHKEAVKSALAYLNDVAGYTRRGKAGATLEKIDLAIATFLHGTSRAQDPQLHTHALVLNLAKREDGTCGTIEPKEIFRNKMAAGALYRAELSKLLEINLGLESERVGSWFELKGVPKSVISEFSKRRKEIEELLAKRANSGAVAAKFATLDSRGVKGHVPRDELFREWKRVGEGLGFSERKAKALLGRTINKSQDYEKLEAKKLGLEKITYHESHFSRRELVRFIAEFAQTRGLGAEEILSVVDKTLSDEVINLGKTYKGEKRYTTKETLELEKDLVKKVSLLDKNNHIVVSINSLESLSLEQQKALEHVCSPGGIKIVSGMAGTGKSHLLGAVREVFEGENINVLGCAVAGRAADGLRQESGIRSQTVHSLILDLERDPSKLNSRTVLILDEAGMAGTKIIHDLVSKCEENRSKLILVGDSKQLQPITAGAPLSHLEGIQGSAKLEEIRRQNEPWAREAVKLISKGEASKGLAWFVLKGQMKVEDSREETISSIIRDWGKFGRAEPKNHLMLTSTNFESFVLNQKAQQERIKTSEIKGRGLSLGDISFYKGDRVLFTKNSKLFGVKNGSLGEVLSINLSKKELRIELDSKQKVSIPLNEYQDLKLGYAITTHKAQGITVENAYVLLGTQDRESSYVQVSRSKNKTHLFVDRDSAGEELTVLARNMANSRKKLLSLSLLDERTKTHRARRRS